MLNRAALIVRPAEPFIAWAQAIDPAGPALEPEGEQTIYLVPEYVSPDDAEAVLQAMFAEVFERELESWHTIAADWPANRTLGMFREWFAIEMHSMVVDLCADPLEDDG